MNKTMIQRLIHAVMLSAAAVLLLAACQQDEFLGGTPAVKEGYVALNFTADVPAMEVVETRSVDPDGGGVQNMTLFCFDRYGLFITTATATLAENSGVSSGTFQAQVPDNTRIIHFVANQVTSTFKQDDFLNQSEAAVMALLEGSSGRMIYWARFACQRDKDESIDKQLAAAGNEIVMLRNHAKVSVANPTNNQWFTVTGFAVYNTNAFGTVAPYHPEKGFAFTQDEWDGTEFVTLPENRAKLSDVTDVTSAMGRYIFECENSLKDPVSVILKGRNDGDTQERYYRVMLMQDGEQILLRRNHDYQINIAGPLSFGQDTFAEALEAAATNNVWISISDKVNEVEDQNYILTVDKTDYVIDAEQGGHPYTLTYTIKGKNGKQLTDADKAEVTWIDNEVARQQMENHFTLVSDPQYGPIGKGEITINLLPLGGNDKLEGTLLVKKGRLQRKIKVVMVKRQSFAPSWVGSEIFGGMNQDPTKERSHLTVMFTIPENCPAELFPIKTYISVGGLDIRPESGMALTVVRAGEKEWYSSGSIEPEPDFKYLYVADKPGVHRVYFHNILAQEDNYQDALYIEAEHFETMRRTFTYSSSRKSITVTGLKAYTATAGVEDMAKDEYILYRLVPQKWGANVTFNLQLMDKTGDGADHDMQGVPFNADPKDEFMLYSQYLNHYTADVEGSPDVNRFECQFYPEQSAAWSAQNNPLGGRMLMFKPIKPTNPDKTGEYTIYMYTNRPRSEEVIRIATNRAGMPAISPEGGTYLGNSYRSVIFELANYNPFRFGSKLKYGDGDFVGEEPNREGSASIPEEITPMTWTYEPEIPVDIAIDVTSFRGTDDNSVDPFGVDFDIFIDAPMLKLAKNDGLDEKKLREVSPGRFAYRVEANREDERKFFENSGLTVTNVDKSKDGVPVNQTGERKLLHFETKDIVSAGDIVISSDEERVVFYTKTFRIQNKSIEGFLKYRTENGDEVVPEGNFVAFEMETDGSRIGSITVGANGAYELRLRKEYKFSWLTTKVLFYFEKDEVVYQATFDNLESLFKNTEPIVMTPKP